MGQQGGGVRLGSVMGSKTETVGWGMGEQDENNRMGEQDGNREME